MACYVDNVRLQYGRMKMSHLMADTIPELLAMVDQIGVDRKWIQLKRYIHFDISDGKRAEAIVAGAIKVTAKEMVNRFRGVDIVPPCAHCGGTAWELASDPNVFRGQDYGDRYPRAVSLQHHGYQVRCECGIQTCWWHYNWEALESWATRKGASTDG